MHYKRVTVHDYKGKSKHTSSAIATPRQDL